MNLSAPTIKERGILFSAPMILALLAGAKTETRRLMKPQPIISPGAAWDSIEQWDEWEWPVIRNGVDGQSWEDALFHCPYGQVGDRLYVRETLKRGVAIGELGPNGLPTIGYSIQHAATLTPVPYAPGAKAGWCGRALWQWKRKTIPAIHMPRWASRLTLELTDVGMEPVQKITEEAVRREGLPECLDCDAEGERHRTEGPHYRIEDYQELWDKLNGKRADWKSNPWVWVLTFRVVEAV